MNRNKKSRRFPQPTVRRTVKPAYVEHTLTGEPPNFVGRRETIRAEWDVSEFVWLTKGAKEVSPDYEGLLTDLGISEEDYGIDVDGFHHCIHTDDEKRDCDLEGIYLPIVRCGKYHPYASEKHRRRASSRALDRLEFLEEECRKRRVKFDYLICIDLTLPKNISELWCSKKVQICVRKAVRDFLRLLYEDRYPNKKSKFGSLSNHHFWSSKYPLNPHRHIHLNMPNVVYDGRIDVFHRIAPTIGVDGVRKCWRKALVKNGLWVGIPDHVEPDVYLRYIKFEERDKVLHRLSYCARKPIQDVAKTLERGAGRMNVKNAVEGGDYDKDYVLFLLDFTPRVVNLGFLTNLKRFGYSRKPIVLKCPICGGDMVIERDCFGSVVVYDRPPPDIPKLIQNRIGEWERADVSLVDDSEIARREEVLEAIGRRLKVLSK